MLNKLRNLFTPKIEVFVRYCHFSNISQHKHRFLNFSREKCYDNLLATLDPKRVNLTFLLDTFYPSGEIHFIRQQQTYSVIEISEGTEAGSFLRLLDHVSSLSLH